MTTLSFPCRPPRSHGGGIPLPPGTPARAPHCECDSQQILDVHGESCERCGRWTHEVVAATWQGRAQQIADGTESG